MAEVIPIYKALVPAISPKQLAIAKIQSAYEILDNVYQESTSPQLRVQLSNTLAALGIAIKELEK